MVVRSQQIDSLATDLHRKFERDLAVHLRDRFPERLGGTSEESLASTIGKGVRKAERYGVKTDYDVRRFAEYMVEYGSDFDTNPRTAWAGRILNGNETGTEKMDALDAHTTFELRRRRP